jgi:hypothetical protein
LETEAGISSWKISKIAVITAPSKTAAPEALRDQRHGVVVTGIVHAIFQQDGLKRGDVADQAVLHKEGPCAIGVDTGEVVAEVPILETRLFLPAPCFVMHDGLVAARTFKHDLVIAPMMGLDVSGKAFTAFTEEPSGKPFTPMRKSSIRGVRPGFL